MFGCLLMMTVLTLYCIGSVGIIWLICTLMGWPFSVPMAIGVFMVANGVLGIMKGRKKKDASQ